MQTTLGGSGRGAEPLVGGIGALLNASSNKVDLNVWPESRNFACWMSYEIDYGARLNHGGIKKRAGRKHSIFLHWSLERRIGRIKTSRLRYIQHQ